MEQAHVGTMWPGSSYWWVVASQLAINNAPAAYTASQLKPGTPYTPLK